MKIKVFKKNEVALYLQITKSSIFHFTLELPNVAYNYRNPIRCLYLALKDLMNERDLLKQESKEHRK